MYYQSFGTFCNLSVVLELDDRLKTSPSVLHCTNCFGSLSFGTDQLAVGILLFWLLSMD